MPGKLNVLCNPMPKILKRKKKIKSEEYLFMSLMIHKYLLLCILMSFKKANNNNKGLLLLFSFNEQ